MSKVAIASTEGITINEHFGRSKEFWIYEIAENGSYTFLQKREVPQDITASAQHPAITAIELLSDVEAVLAAQIGRQAEFELRSRGILSLTVNSLVDKALAAYAKRGKYIRGNVIQNTASSCGGSACICPGGCK